MTTKPNDGGPAFPQVSDGFHGIEATGGLSMRDWFAGQALVGLLSEPQPEDGEPELGLGHDYAANAAKAAYRVADAMLAARTAAQPARR